jgi:CAAX protease family protein
MREEVKHATKRFGLGILNLTAAIALVVVAQAIARGHLSQTAFVFIAAVIMSSAYFVGGPWIERRRPAEFGLRSALPQFAGGIILGILLFSAVMALLSAIGPYHPSGWGTPSFLAAGAILSFFEAVVEEILFRGFLFRLVETLTGTWWALVATSALFGAAHAFNPGATLPSSIAIALEAGALLGAAYALTGRLWFPIGLHAAWNFTEGYVFGMTVSGFTQNKGLITGTLKGPALLTGGAFGPEASILATLLCFSVALLLLWRVVRSGRIRPPAWSRSSQSAPSPASLNL